MSEGSSNELTAPMRRVEERLGAPLATWLAAQYETRTLADIADELGVAESTISKWLARLGIEARFPGQRPKASV